MDARIRLKVGNLEIEYEGSDSFIKSDLLALVSKAIDLIREQGVDITTIDDTSGQQSIGGKTSGTTSTIATKLGSKSGTDLIVAAAARLTLVMGLESFSRQQLLDEMKLATAYYKKSYSNNLTKYLQQLVKAGELIEAAKDTYALSASKRSELEKTIA